MLMIMSLLCFVETVDAQIKESINEQNPDYVKWVTNKEQIQTSEEHTLGYRPHPFLIHTELPASEREKLKTNYVPASYDLRNLGGVTSVKDQGGCGSCWTFATMASIESRWLVTGRGTYDLSEDNLNTCHTPFIWAPCDGGNSEISAACLMRGSGPISEADDPYNDNNTSIDCPGGLVPQGLVTDAWFLPTTDPELIKNCIMQYGALATNMCWVSSAYNSSNYTYYYSGTESTNHAVTLVGWDDTKTTAAGTGAWIIKNSWGSGWGEGGYFYISYQDTKVNTTLAVFPQYIDYTTETKVSTYSEAGWISGVGYGSGTNSADALVKFTANGNVQIDRIGTAAVQAGTVITIEIYDNFNGSNSLTGLLGSIPAQTCTYTGYHNFGLATPIDIADGEDYYIKTNYLTLDYGFPIPIEKVVADYCTPPISNGIFWFKSTGSSYWSLSDGNGWDPCVYVYTSPGPDKTTVQNPEFTPVAGTFSSPIDVTISCITNGASIYYTLDGTDPDETDNLYLLPVTIDQTTTLKARAYSSGSNPSEVFSGLYTIICDEIITFDTASVCDGETYTFGNQTLTESGEYTEVFPSVNGCDSTVVLTLTVYPTFNHTDTAAICAGDTLPFGTQTLTATGQYTEVFPSVNGCDSTVVLTLTVYPAFNHIDTAAICAGDTLVFGTQTLTATGEYTEVFPSVNGCDSTVVLTLTTPIPLPFVPGIRLCSARKP